MSWTKNPWIGSGVDWGSRWNQSCKYRNKFLGFIFQSFNLINYKTALENVSLPLYCMQAQGATRESIAVSLLLVLLIGRHLASELSGGQKQRVLPCHGLGTQVAVSRWAHRSTRYKNFLWGDGPIQKSTKKGKPFWWLPTKKISRKCKRIVRLKDGVIVEDTKVDQVLAAQYVNRDRWQEIFEPFDSCLQFSFRLYRGFGDPDFHYPFGFGNGLKHLQRIFLRRRDQHPLSFRRSNL